LFVCSERTAKDQVEEETEDDKEFTSGTVDKEDEVGEEEATKEGEEAAGPSTTTEDNKEEDDKAVTSITESLSNMSVSTKSFDMSVQAPYIMYQYVDYGRDVVLVDFLIPSIHRKWTRARILPCGTAIELAIVIPPVFYNPMRLLAANTENRSFNNNTSKAVAFQKAAQEILKTENEFEEVLGKKPQRIRLPFKCETEFYQPPGTDPEDDETGWEIQLFDNDDAALVDELAAPSDIFVLSADMVSVVKPKLKKKKGKMRKVDMRETGDDVNGEENIMGDE
jgi:hypothetical protein